MSISVIFTTCKKYPENTLWFKNPTKIHSLQGYITKYTVNGIDSLHLMDSYFGNYSGSPNLIKDLSKAEFRITSGNYDKKLPEYNIVFPPFANLAELYVSFKNHKKYVSIKTRIDTSILKRSLFMDVDWKIIRLAKSGPFKIETTLNNGNKYEIQFN